MKIQKIKIICDCPYCILQGTIDFIALSRSIGDRVLMDNEEEILEQLLGEFYERTVE